MAGNQEGSPNNAPESLFPPKYSSFNAVLFEKSGTGPDEHEK